MSTARDTDVAPKTPIETSKRAKPNPMKLDNRSLWIEAPLIDPFGLFDRENNTSENRTTFSEQLKASKNSFRKVDDSTV